MERNQARFARVAHALLGDAVRSVVEVGARDCRETLGFRALYRDARIYAFECNPATLPLCRERVAGQPGITLVERAVSDRAGRLRFYPIDPAATPAGRYNPGASSLLRASGAYEHEDYVQTEIEVEAVTLEGFMREAGLEDIDLLWMDIQGAELAALRGLGERIAAVKLIHLEAEFVEIYAGQPLFPEVRSFLEAHGFRFIGFTIWAAHSADAVFANTRRFGVFDTLRALAAEPLLAKKRLAWAGHRLRRHLSGA